MPYVNVLFVAEIPKNTWGHFLLEHPVVASNLRFLQHCIISELIFIIIIIVNYYYCFTYSIFTQHHIISMQNVALLL